LSRLSDRLLDMDLQVFEHVQAVADATRIHLQHGYTTSMTADTAYALLHDRRKHRVSAMDTIASLAILVGLVFLVAFLVYAIRKDRAS